MASVVQAQNYPLQPGDVLRADITRLGNASWTSMVDTNGFVRFPFIGRHFARGKTLEELQEDIILSVVGQRISVMDGNSETVVVLNESSVFLDVAEYRPVTVVGAVGAPGNVVYRPGLTVRAAEGIAGGMRQVLATDARPERIAALAARVTELQKTEAWLMMDLWRVRGQLDPALTERPPEGFADILTARLPPKTLAEMPERISEARRDRALELQELRDRIALTEDSVSYLTLALDQYEVVSRGEEERLTNLLTLQDRGLTVANNVNSARAGALSASSRLLQTEADLSEARRELSGLRRQVDTFDLDIRQELLTEEARVLRAIDESGARLQGARQELMLLSGQAMDPLDNTVIDPTIVLHRQTDDAIVSLRVQLNDTVFPGDVIEVFMGDAPMPE
jgi:polysaccharide export outer membrane protein